MAEETLRRFSTKKGWYRHPRRREAEDLLRKGARPGEVAAQVEVDYRTVWYWRKRLRLPDLEPLPRHPRFEEARQLLAQGKHPVEIAPLVGANVYTVYRWRKRYGAPCLKTPDRPGTKAEAGPKEPPTPTEARLCCQELLRAGRSAAEIASALGMRVHTVQNWRQRMGLPPPHEVRRQRALGLLREGAAPMAVAKETGVSLRLVRRWNQGLHRPRRVRLSPDPPR